MDQSCTVNSKEFVLKVKSEISDLGQSCPVSAQELVSIVKSEIPEYLVKSDTDELVCVVCSKPHLENFEICSTEIAASGISVHTFLSKFTNTELAFSLDNFICKKCMNLVNELEHLEMEYKKLKYVFQTLITKNPLFNISTDENEAEKNDASPVFIEHLENDDSARLLRKRKLDSKQNKSHCLESEQPLVKKAQSPYDTLSSDSSQDTHQSSQWSQNIITESGHIQDEFNTIHTITVNHKKKERQQRYRERNRDKLKQREAERRKRMQFLLSIVEPSTSSDINRIEFNNEIIDANSQSSSGFEGTQTSSSQRNEQTNDKKALQKERARQRYKRYKEKNREMLRQREAERRRRIRIAEMITKSYNSSNPEFTELINEPIVDIQVLGE